MKMNKTNPIHGLDKVPVEALYKMERIKRGADESYIQELEYENNKLRDENKRLYKDLDYMENNPRGKVAELTKLLHRALKGTPLQKKAVKAEVYRNSTLEELVTYKQKSEGIILRQRQEIAQLRRANKNQALE